MSDEELVITQYTIYERPADHPDCFVVRQWHIYRGDSEPMQGEARTADTLDDARELVPEGLVCIVRSPEDDETIVETWT